MSHSFSSPPPELGRLVGWLPETIVGKFARNRRKKTPFFFFWLLLLLAGTENFLDSWPLSWVIGHQKPAHF
jgi:hypothetical protein